MRHKTALLLVVVVVICSLGTVARAGLYYTVTDLGTLGGTGSAAYAINASGQVTGFSTVSGDPFKHVFLYSGGVMQDLGRLPGPAESVGLSINNAGVIVGYGSSYWKALIWDSVSGLRELPVPGTRPYHLAYGINDAGHIIAQNADFYSGSEVDDMYISKNGTWTFIPTLPGGSGYGLPAAISNSDQVVGFGKINGAFRGFVWDESHGTQALGTLGGAISMALDVSDSGQITGYATRSDGAFHAVIWSGASITDLDTLGGTNSAGLGINTSGQVVGYSYPAGDVAYHAFVYSEGTMFDLNNLIDPSAAWTLTMATAINDNGWITVAGTLANGEYHAFLLTPTVVPVPAGVLLGLLGLGAAGWRLKKRGTE